MTEKEILDVLYTARKNQRISREKVAFELECENSSLLKMESGDIGVRLPRLLRWAKYLGLELIIQPKQK